jgi:tetratricopeptide (TPR) repeat protein
VNQPVPQTTNAVPQLARHVHQQLVTAHLLEYLFPGFDSTQASLERYSLLAKAIDAAPRLREVLLSNGSGIGHEWGRVLTSHESDVQFLHALAVLYRERAASASTESPGGTDRWRVGTALWAVLLSSTEFWRYFSPDRVTDSPSGRRSLTDTEQEAVFDRAVQIVLSIHGREGRRAFAAGRYETAAIHLRCLELCRSGREQLLEALSNLGQPCKLHVEENQLRRVREVAGELLDDWGAGLVREAEKASDDPEAIRQLPEGIRKNYEGGLQCLEPFIRLNIPVSRVLRASLHWYNEWCYDLYPTKNFDGIKTLVQSAQTVADRLIPFCIRMRGQLPENVELSKHFFFRGCVSDAERAPEQALEYYEEAIAWNPANQHANQFLGGAKQDVLLKQLATAIRCAEQKQFREAHEVLDVIEKEAEDKKLVQKSRGIVWYHEAADLADRGEFRAALNHAGKAATACPGEEVVQQLHREMSELAPEEDTLRLLRTANEAMEMERFDEAIAHAGKVAKSSRFAKNARQLQSNAHFRRGIKLANQQQQFEHAERDLEAALRLSEQADDRTFIAEQLAVVRQASGTVWYREAVDLADKGELRAALDRVGKAAKACPGEEAFQKLHREMSELAPEEDNLRLLRNANEAMEMERFDGAIAHAGKVPESSRFAKNARQVQSTAYFRRGIKLANEQQQFEKAEPDLEAALWFSELADDRTFIAEQLAVVRQARRNQTLNAALDRKEWDRAEQILRGELAGTPSPSDRKGTEQQLSVVLNMHAVDLIDSAQAMEKKFGDALTAIVEEVKRRQGVS